MLHQSTQRRICRSLFLLACVLPTLSLAAWVVWRTQPSYQQRQLAQLGESLGVRLTCRAIRTPRPGVAIYQQVSVLDSETGALLAQIDTLRCDQQTTPQLTGGMLEIDAGQFSKLAQAVELALRRNHTPGAQIRFQQIQATALGQWRDVKLELSNAPAGPAAGRVLELCESAPNSARLRLTRNRQLDPPQTRLTFATGGNTLPWHALRGLTPLPADLGAEAAFQGSLTLSWESGLGELSGSLTGVNLAKLAPSEAALSTQQPAEIPAINLAWRGARLTNLDLSVSASQGEVALWFADVLRHYLHCIPAEEFNKSIRKAQTGELRADSPLLFDALAFRLKLDAAGLRVSCPPANQASKLAGGLMLRNGRRLLSEPLPGPPNLVEALLEIAKSPGKQFPQHCPRARALSELLPISSASLMRR